MKWFFTFLFTTLSFCAQAQEESKNLSLSVDNVQKNTLPSSKYDNFGNEPIEVPHPNAEKGLQRITSDKTYIYATEASPQKYATSVRLGLYEPTELSNPDNPDVTFSKIYGESSSPFVLIDMEWNWFQFLGKVNFQLGTGVFVATGKGRFKNDPDPSHEARENFTFVAFPFTGNLIWRLQVWEKQWLVPYGGGGAGIMAFSEFRDDNAGPKFGGAGVAQAFAGGGLSLNALSPRTAAALDREYGVNNTWITFEYRLLTALNENFDFSGQVINAGLFIEY